MASPGTMYVPPPRRHSVVGPLILIVIGVLFLLRNFGFRLPLLHQFVQYWPLLLVVIGLVRLAEYFAARNRQQPVPRMGGGTVFLLVILIVVGAGLSALFHARNQINWGSVRDNVDVDDQWMHLFGNQYTFDGELTQALPAGGAVRVNCERGNITVNSWDQAQVKVVYHKRIFAGSQSEADSTNQATAPRLLAQGTTVEVAGQYGRRRSQRGCVRPGSVCSAEGGCGADGASRGCLGDRAYGRGESELAARGCERGSGDGKRQRHEPERVACGQQREREGDGGRTGG